MRADTNAPFAHSKPEPYTVYERAHMATLATPAEKKGQQVPEEKSERKPRPRVDEKFKIFSGTANEALADEVCHFLGLTRGQAMLRANPGERARR
jgi:hypothetical protein